MKNTLRLPWQGLLLVLPLVAGDYNSTEICSWDRPRVGLIRTQIFLEGGGLTLVKDGSCENAATADSNTGFLFSLNLSDPFDISNNDTPAMFNSIDEGAMKAFYFDGAMFHDDDELYAWGSDIHILLPIVIPAD